KACDRIGDIDPRVAVRVAAGRAERRGEESPVVDVDGGDLRLRGGKRMAVLRADEDGVRVLGAVARDILDAKLDRLVEGIAFVDQDVERRDVDALAFGAEPSYGVEERKDDVTPLVVDRRRALPCDPAD